MPLSPNHAKHSNRNWSEVFRRQGHNNNKAEQLSKANNNADIVNNTASLFHTVETLQESAALVVPGPGKSIRTLHHCFSDLRREKVIGVHGLRNYSPFKEAASESLVSPFQPPATRETQNLVVLSFDDFTKIERAEDLTTKTFDGGPENIDTIQERPASVWVTGDHMTKFYGKTSRASTVAMQIIKIIPEELTAEAKRQWEETFYDQLLFLWAVEKGFASTITLKDPPDSDEVQELIEEVNSLLVADGKTDAASTNKGITVDDA